MNEDQAGLDSMFSPLSLGNDIGSVSSGFNFMASPVVTSTIAAPVSSASGANPTAGVNGFQAVLAGLTSMFSSGVAAYNTVATKTGLPLANGEKTSPSAVAAQAAAAPVFAGLTMNQLLLIGGGIAVVGVILLMKRR